MPGPSERERFIRSLRARLRRANLEVIKGIEDDLERWIPTGSGGQVAAAVRRGTKQLLFRQADRRRKAKLAGAGPPTGAEPL